MLDSVIDQIIEEEHFEASLKHRTSQRYKSAMHSVRMVKVKHILENIEKNLKKKGAYPLDKLETYLENYEQYPEIRPLAEKVLPKIIEGRSVQQKRLNLYNRLRRKMKEIQQIR